MPFHSNRVAGFRVTALGASLLISAASVASVACDRREAPSEIRVEMPPVVASPDLVAVSVQATFAPGGTRRITEGAEYGVVPSDLGAVGPAGFVKCQKSGDGKVTVSIAGVTQSAPLHCRLVDHIEVQKLLPVELTAGAFKPVVRVLDRAGSELSDVPVSFFSKNSGVVYPKDGQLVPKLVGQASLVARAGQRSADFQVDVVRRVTPEALPIEQNRKIYFSLEPGKYQLKVTLPAPHRLNVEWRGAPYCNGATEGTQHSSVCALRAQGGGVVFDNPGYLKDGSLSPSIQGVELFEVP